MHTSARNTDRLSAVVRDAIAGVVRLYQVLISPFLPPSCRFTPTCSEFARQALLKHGILRGSWMALRRVGRCHPFSSSGGYDPVP